MTASAGPARQVAAVVLAAGCSSRFGGSLPKQLIPFGGVPLVRRAAQAALAAALAEVVVVVGYERAAVRRALDGLPLSVVDNPLWLHGQSSSLRAGIAALTDASHAALFLPCDQPLLTAEVLDQVADAYRRTSSRVVVPTFGGRRGAPVLFDRSLFPELAALEGDAGGRQILGRHQAETVFVPLASEGPLLDVDRPQDLEALLRGESAMPSAMRGTRKPSA